MDRAENKKERILIEETGKRKYTGFNNEGKYDKKIVDGRIRKD